MGVFEATELDDVNLEPAARLGLPVLGGGGPMDVLLPPVKVKLGRGLCAKLGVVVRGVELIELLPEPSCFVGDWDFVGA